MKTLQYFLCAMVLGLSILAVDASAQRRGGGGGRGNGGGGRPAPQFNPQPRMQQPAVRVPNVSGGTNITGAARVNAPGVNAATRIDSNVRAASGNFPVNRAVNQSIYRNNINIGQRSFAVAPNTYRASAQNYPWHRG